MQVSANLGFLWADLPLADGIRAAHAAGFHAVECHWPYAEDKGTVRAALQETGLPMLGLNTHRGGTGCFGLSALPDHIPEARAAIDQAIAYAGAIDAQSIHVMAGMAHDAEARGVFLDNLRYALDRTDRMILIEPLNAFDAPGYFLSHTDQAAELIDAVGHDQLRLMFDCYHVGRTEGDVLDRLTALVPLTGHIQFAAVPDRGPPDHGSLDFPALFSAIDSLGWTRPLGAEYLPRGPVEASLDWLAPYRVRP